MDFRLSNMEALLGDSLKDERAKRKWGYEELEKEEKGNND